MRPCYNCKNAGISNECRIGANSERCVAYTAKGYSCNLAPFSPARWARLRRQREEKLQQSNEALARFTRLQREVKVLEEKERLMVEGELENITDLEKDEEAVASLSSDDFLFNVASEQLVLPSLVDWDALGVSPGETAVRVTGSS